MNFIESLEAFDKYYQSTLAPVQEGSAEEENQVEFNASVYNNLVKEVIVQGVLFKVCKMSIFNKNQYSNYIGLVNGNVNMSEEKMFEVSEFLPKIYKITKIMEGIRKEDAACLIYLLDPTK